MVDRVSTALPVSQDYHLLNTEFAVHALPHPEVADALAVHRRALREALIPVQSRRPAASAVRRDHHDRYLPAGLGLIAVVAAVIVRTTMSWRRG